MSAPLPWQLEALAPPGVSSVRIVLGRALVEGPLPEGPIPLDVGVDDPVEVHVDQRLAAYGEVVVLDGKLAVRITAMVPPAQQGAT